MHNLEQFFYNIPSWFGCDNGKHITMVHFRFAVNTKLFLQNKDKVIKSDLLYSKNIRKRKSSVVVVLSVESLSVESLFFRLSDAKLNELVDLFKDLKDKFNNYTIQSMSNDSCNSSRPAQS